MKRARYLGLMSALLGVISMAVTAPIVDAKSRKKAKRPATAAVAASTPAYLNPNLSPEVRARDLVSRMTLEEKAHQLGNTAPAIPRLKVPAYNYWNEGLHGVARAGIATVFPQAIGMAASWDEPMMKQVGDVISTEFRAKFVERVHPDGSADWYRGLTVWSPNINIFRDPRWGRGQETYGEDPYLTSRMGIGFIQGLQGNDPKYFKTIATSKHFAVHSGPENNRHREDVHPSPHDLEDTYLPAFRATVTEGKVYSVMCAYNAISGVPACANAFLMNERLRQDWGFKGFVVSDCGGAANVFRPDALHYTKTPEEGVTMAFQAGMDNICADYRNNMSTEPQPIINAVTSGQMPVSVIDQALERTFVARFRLGLFDPASMNPYGHITPKDNDTPAHGALALKMAQESMVLLKNEGNILPLKGDPKVIAVIGPNADSFDALVGNYYGMPSKPVTILDGIKARYPNAKIIYTEGTGLIGRAEPPVPNAVLCVDAACSQMGLRGSYYANPNLDGTPSETRIDANAGLSWMGEIKNGSARWEGFVKAPESGDYYFRYLSERGYRLWVNGQAIADEWRVGDVPSIVKGNITLEAGKTYSIRIEAVQTGPRGSQKLLWTPPSQNGDDAVEAAKQADLVIYAGGLSARIEGEELKLEAPGFAGGDRTSLDLPAPQQKLLERVAATGKPIIFVNMSGSPVALNWADEHVAAIIQAWYPGQAGGTAVAGLIAGDYSPAGRLPLTFYRSVEGLPAFNDYSMKGRTYRYFNGEVLYPFGYGLSYTRFDYKDAGVSAADGKVTVSVKITNAGLRDSDEVVQLYVSRPDIKDTPIRALQGFKRVHLKAGETKTVSFTLSDRALSVVDMAGNRVIVPGTVKVWVGGGQPIARKDTGTPSGAETQFEITSGAMLPK